jgi:uroporphyrinogen III methyltransferase/synthase
VARAFLVGVGPGEPGGVSRRAAEVLGAADVVVADAEVEEACVCSLVGEGARRVRLPAQPGEQEREHSRARMVVDALAGALVARVRLGDGWTAPEALRDARVLRDAGVEIEIAPGAARDAGRWVEWLASRPLFGRRVVVTRMREQASRTAELLRERGADPWVVPTIELHPPPDPERLERAGRDTGSYDLVAFTSANGVEQFFEALARAGLDARAFGATKVAAIGSATAASLLERGVRADVVAKEFRGEALAEAIRESVRERGGRRVLVARALEAREVLPQVLRQAGLEVDVVAAYRTSPPSHDRIAPLAGALERGAVDAVLLTSSSTATNLCGCLGERALELLAKTCVASIGPITSETARALGLAVAVEASVYTVPGLVAALEAHFAAGGSA